METSLNLELGVVENNDLDSNYPNPSLESILAKSIYNKVRRYSGIETIPVIGSGSDQLLERLTSVLSSKDNLHILPQPAYFSHLEYLQKNNSNIITFQYDLDNPSNDIAKKVSEGLRDKTKVNPFVWITTPNNPTGVNIDVKSLLNKNLSIIVDEAYGEFSDKTPFSSSALNYMESDNVIVLRSFSKGLGLAGTRLGYLLTTNQNIADALRISLPLFPISRNTLEKGISAMGNYEALSEEMRSIGKERREYFLEKISMVQKDFDERGIKLNYTQPKAITCMIWANKDGKSIDLHNYLSSRDVYVQNLRNIAGLPDSAIRVTMAEKDKTDRFFEILRNFEENKNRPKFLEYI